MESASESSSSICDAPIGGGKANMACSRAVSVPVSLAKVGETGVVDGTSVNAGGWVMAIIGIALLAYFLAMKDPLFFLRKDKAEEPQ